MKTEFSLAQLADPDIAEADKILRACVHCGFCTATCPTYVLLGDELDSPRGRIYLIKEMLEKDRPPTGEVVKHIDRCLSCLACMTTCPSGVNYMHLVDHARTYIEETYTRPFPERMLRRTLAPLYAVLVHKYWWDEFYVFTVVRPVVWVARQLRTFDIYVIDGAVNAVGIIFVWLSRLYRVFDLYVVDGAVNLVGWLARATGGALRHVQTGRAQNYLLVLALGVIVLAVIGITR